MAFKAVPLIAVLVAGLSVAGGAQAQAAPDPYGIFAQARAFWMQQQYPPYLGYDVAVTVDEGGVPKTERYASQYDATNGALVVDPVSDWETAHPSSGRGVNLGIFGLPLNKALPPVDFMGVPELAPTYSFGMAPFIAMQPPHRPSPEEVVAAVRAQFHDPSPRATTAPVAPSGLHTIATVVSSERDYNIVLVGEESVNGVLCYHLALTPLHQGSRFRLRDVWIDESSYATERLREALNFNRGPGTAVAWTIDFGDIGGSHYIAKEQSDAPMSYEGLIYQHASVAFENIQPLAAPPRNLGSMVFPPAANLVLSEPSTP